MYDITKLQSRLSKIVSLAEWSGIVPNEIIRNEHRERFRINYFRFHFVDGNSLAYTQLFKKRKLCPQNDEFYMEC